MASDPSDFKERCCGKDEANACEGKPGQVVDHGCYGDLGHIIRNIDTTIIIIAARIPEKTSFSGPDVIITYLFSGTCVTSYRLAGNTQPRQS
jgi:hypothetical protein